MQLALHKSKISVLLPDSFLDNEDTLLLKTRKIGTLARTTTMFRIGQVYFYRDNGSDKARKILNDICNYLYFPPYLRKYAPHSPNLRYSAILPPIHSPNHFGVEYKKSIFVVGIVVENFRGKISVDIGKKKLIEITHQGKQKEGDEIIVKTIGKTTSVQDKIPPSLYWKTQFEVGDQTLEEYLQIHSQSYVIASSKSGKPITSKILLQLQNQSNSPISLALGPIKGSFRDYIKNTDLIHMWINMIPDQGTRTVKIEEALHSALTLMNVCSLNLK